MTESDAAEIGRSGAIVFIGTVISMAAGFLFKLLLSNQLTASQFGSVMLAISFLGIISIPSVFGLNQGVIKFTSSTSSNKEKSGYIVTAIVSTLLLSLLLSIIIYFLLPIIRSNLFKNEVDELFMILTLITLPIISLTKVMKGSLQGLKQPIYFTIFSQITQPITRIIFAVGAAILFATTASVAGGIFFAYILTIIIGLYYLSKSGLIFRFGTISEVKSLLRFSAPLFVSSSLYILLTRVDRVLVGYFLNPVSVGQYEIAVTIALLLRVFKSTFSFLLFPKVSELDAKGKAEKIPRLYQQTTKWILIVATPAFLILLARPAFLINMFGDKYTTEIIHPILAILSIGFFIDTVLGPNGDALIGFGKSKISMYYNLASLLINIPLNIILIPIYGLEGAAIATIVGYSVMNLLKSLDLYRNHDIICINKSMLKILISGSAIIAPLLYFPTSSNVVEAVLLSICYISSVAIILFSLYISGEITSEDKRLVEIIRSALSS